MLEPVYAKRFEKDLKLAGKRGKNLEKLKLVIKTLLDKQPLSSKYRDHWLTGNYAGRRECHIEPDWLLIYKPSQKVIIFERLGTHSDLFN